MVGVLGEEGTGTAREVSKRAQVAHVGSDAPEDLVDDLGDLISLEEFSKGQGLLADGSSRCGAESKNDRCTLPRVGGGRRRARNFLDVFLFGRRGRKRCRIVKGRRK